MEDTAEILKKLALQVRNASSAGENTAERVGRVLSGILELIDAGSDIEELKKLFLSKTTDDRTDYSLEIGKDLTVEGILKSLGGIISKGLVKAESGLEVAGGISTDSLAASGDIAGKNISASETVSSKNVSATETVSGKNINATKKVSAETVVAGGAVKGNYVDATEDVSGKNVLASEGVGGKTVTATETVKGNHVQAVETVSGKNASISNKVTTLNLLVQALADIYDLNVSHVATLFRTIVKDYISSEQFIPGFTGNGMKLYKALNGDWNLELDNLTVRKAMTVFELIISKIRAVNGGLVISPANGKVKSVLLTNGLYRLEIEDDMMFVADDLVRCQSFSVKSGVKYYWVRITSVSGSYIFINATEFTNSLPAIGDDLVQFGNKTNKLRQGLLYLTAAEDGKPRISVLDGVNSTDLTGKTKVILGCLDDIVDSDFSADSQPSGYGLYAQNVFLKGMFILRSGKTVESELDTTNTAVKAAKSVADAAKTAAGTAQTTANTAVTNAATANTLLADLASDNKLTATEKQQTKKEWDAIVSEKVKNDASADKFGVSKTVYGTAYAALNTYITPLLSSLTTTSAITGTEFRDKFKAYYDARTDLLNAVSAKAKELADTAQAKANKAETDAGNAQKAASDAASAAGVAQSTANNAVKSADGATALLADIASDNKLTAQEKQSAKKEWEIIVSEKTKNDASADRYGISKTAYATVYTALSSYITPLLTNLAVTSDIVGATFRSTFKAYYDSRTDLLNAISAKSKDLADSAQAKADSASTAASAAQRDAAAANASAGAAQATANNAATSANAANTLLTDIASDNKLTPTEKQSTKKEWDVIASEKALNNASAVKFGIATTAYDTVYSALNTYITPLLTSLTTTSNIVGTDFRAKFKAYYDARTNLLNTISEKAKTLADAAQTKANSAATAASTAQIKANEAFTAAGSAQTAANNAQTSANGANALLTDIASDNKLTPTEKQSTKKEWDIIVSEKPLNNASAVRFGVVTTAYDTAYSTLNTYITPLLASLTTTSNITGTDFRAKFKSYYDARTNLLNSISAKAKSLADDAQSSVDNLRVGGRNLLLNSKVSKSGTAYNIGNWNATRDFSVGEELTVTIKGNIPGSKLFGIWFNTGTFGGYSLAKVEGGIYSTTFKVPAGTSTRTIGIYLISNQSSTDSWSFDWIKLETGNRRTDWTPAPEEIETKITEVETRFEVREGQISAKITEVTTKATQAATSATNAKTSETNASGSATTAGQKATAAANSATAASNSATAAKKSADDAGTILEEVTVKESSITQTAGQIATKVTEVNTKVTEANTAATNAKKSETNAGSSATAAGQKATAASGSAGTAATKAGEAATSATNAKASADSASSKLTTIIEKESSINQTAGSINLKVTEVTKKATEAATSATNAKTSETNAGSKATAAGSSATAAAGSATTAGSKAGEAATSATNAKNSADSAAAKLTTITQKESSINQTASNITLQVTEVTTKASQASTSAANASNAAELAMAMSQGKMLYRDPSFEKGSNGIAAYNNSSNVAVTVARVSGVAGNPNGSGYCLKITTTGAAAPGWGGWFLAPNVKANQRLVYRFIANIPIGRSLSYARNGAGDGAVEKWLTSTVGTGRWEEYAYVLCCGASGAFSGCGHFYLTGGATPTVSTPLVWYLAYATIYDVTDAEVDYIADAAGKYTTKTEHSSSITQLSNSIELKVAKTDFNALGNRVSNAETTITQHTGQIALKAAQSDVTALGTRMSSAEAKITPDAIKLTVKSQTDTVAASAASNAVNGLQVGGRNYFKKATSIIRLTGAATIDRNQSECVNGVYLVGDNSGTSSARIGGVITCNGYWTISFEIRGSQSVAVGFNVDFCDCTFFTARTTTNNTWTKLTFTYNVTNASSVYNFIDLANISWAYVYVRNIKIEQGNKATDWTPAPEDIDAKITAVETAFEIREGQISSKVTQATTSATNAKTSETNAATSATTAGQKATAAANSASDAASKLTAITTKETSINQTASQITIQASTVTTKTAEAVNAAELAAAMSKGRMLYRDPTFESGLNGMGGYALVGSIAVVAITGCPNRLAKGMRIIATGWTSATDLRAGGFLFANQSRANAVFVVRLIANIPIGRSIQNYHNSYGAGGTTKWLTSQAGTGKWQEYACKVTCGASGTFSTVNHFALYGGVAPTAAAPVTWYVAYATVFDTTDVDDVPTVDEVKAGMTVTANKITIFGKDIVLTGAVTADTIAANAVTSIKIAANSITANHIQANAITAAKIAAGVIDATKINVTSIQAVVVTADRIAALNITTKNLTVTNGAKIGNFVVEGGGLYAENTVAIIGMVNSSYTTHMSAGQIVIDHPSAGNALVVNGGLCDVIFDIKNYTLRAGGVYNAPGVLWAGRINRYGSVESSWGYGAGYVTCSREGRGIYRFSHSLNHNSYYVMAMATPYAEDDSDLNFCMIKDKGATYFHIHTVDAGRNWRDMAFEVCIVGNN